MGRQLFPNSFETLFYVQRNISTSKCLVPKENTARLSSSKKKTKQKKKKKEVQDTSSRDTDTSRNSNSKLTRENVNI